MRTRDFRQGDQDAIAAIHAAMGLDYRMPDLDGRMVAAKTVCEVDGEVIAASALKMQAEAFLWVKPGTHPAMKWDAIRLMQRELVKQAVAAGIEQIVAYVPECVGRFFSRRMTMLRWTEPRHGWANWIYEVRQ